MCRVYYVTSPNQKKIVPRMENYEDDGPWMWVAFAPGCRLIVAFAIGPRKQYVADELVESTAKCLSESMPLFVSDGSVSYTHLRAHETRHDLVCRLLLEKKKQQLHSG